jgi:hypothetical protein
LALVCSGKFDEVAHPEPALAPAAEGPGAAHHLAVVLELGLLDLADHLRGILPVVLLEHRLVVEGVHLRGPAVHVEKDDVARARREMRPAAGLAGARDGGIRVERRGRHRAEAVRAAREHLPARQRLDPASAVMSHVVP